MNRILIGLLLLTSGCATLDPSNSNGKPSPKTQKRADVIACIKELTANEATTIDAFEVCRQIYGLSKVQ